MSGQHSMVGLYVALGMIALGTAMIVAAVILNG